jgi:hypothetical protein
MGFGALLIPIQELQNLQQRKVPLGLFEEAQPGSHNHSLSRIYEGIFKFGGYLLKICSRLATLYSQSRAPWKKLKMSSGTWHWFAGT